MTESGLHNLRMNSGDNTYIWRASDWPAWRYDLSALAEPQDAILSQREGELRVGLGWAPAAQVSTR